MATRTLQWKSDAQFDFGSPTKVNVETVGSGDAAYLRLTAKTPGSDDVPFTTPANYTYDAAKIEVSGGVAKLKVASAGDHNFPFTVAGNHTYDDKIEVIGGVATLKYLPAYAWWHFDESSGTNVPDATGNGRVGTTVNMGDVNWVAGKLDNCLQFDGDNEYVNCGNIAGFERTDSFSLECWFKSSSGANLAVMSKITNIIGVGYYVLLSVGQVYFNIQNTQANRIKVRTVLAGLQDDNWHHLVITYDGSSDASGVHIYIDGNDEALYVYQNELSMTIINSANFNFGMMKDTLSIPAYYYKDKIDEGVIYDRELTQSDVTARWNGGDGIGGPPNLYGWWHLNESIGNNVSDSSGNGRGGTTINMEDEDWVAGKLNNCLRFDGVDEYINLGNIANFERTDPFSAEGWFKSSTATIQAIFGRLGNIAPNRGWIIELNASGNLLCYLINDAGASNYIYVYVPTTNWADGVWHHLVFTYDGSSSASGVHIYVDGVDKTLTVGLDALSGTIQNTHTCTISTLNGAVYPFNGDIDEVVFYDQEITQADVTNRYNSGSGTESMQGKYAIDDPDIYPNTGYAFTTTLVTFTETATKPINSEIKYQISSDDGATWKWWNGAAWVAITGAQTDSWYYNNESNLASVIHTNLSNLAVSGTFRFRAFLHSDTGLVRPELDHIYVAEGTLYPIGSFEISMNDDIQPALVVQWLTTTETVTKPANTNISYKYSIDSGANWNASWLTEPNLEAEIQSIVSSKDGTDKIRFKMQLSTTDIYVTPEIDNLNVMSDAGYETSGSYIAIGFTTTGIAYWRNMRFETSAPSGTSLVVSLRFATHTLDVNSIYAVKNDDDSLDIASNYVQWKVEMTGDGFVTPTLSLLELDYQLFEGLLNPRSIDLEC